MEFFVQREWVTDKSTIGEMIMISSSLSFRAFTLEPPIRTDNVKPRAIPAGRYRLTWRYSLDHHCNVPHVENVPGFTAVEIHAGNSAKDTLACTCVAKDYDPKIPDWISHSDEKRDELYDLVKHVHELGDEMWITYIDPPAETHEPHTSANC